MPTPVKYARLIIKGEGLSYRITLTQANAAQVIQFIAAAIPEKERLHHRPHKEHRLWAA